MENNTINPYDQGYKDFSFYGKYENPYALNTEEYKLWEDGYERASDQERLYWDCTAIQNYLDTL